MFQKNSPRSNQVLSSLTRVFVTVSSLSQPRPDSAHVSGGLHDNNGEDTCTSIATVKPQLPGKRLTGLCV